MRSCVSMLSLIRTGIPCKGRPPDPLALRSLSTSAAIDSASGFNSITELIAGPCLSIASMRSRYVLASETAVYFPEAIPACKSAMVSSSSSNAGGALVEALAGDVSLAAAVTLTVAKPMLPAMLWPTKLLRFMRSSLSDEMIDRRHFYADVPEKSNGFEGDSDEYFVLLVAFEQVVKEKRAALRLEIHTDRGSIAHTFGQTPGVREHANCAQRLRIAFKQNSLAGVSAECRGDDLFAQPQLNEIEIGINRSDLQMPGLILAQVIAESFENAIRDLVIGVLRGAVVFDFVDAIRVESRNRAGGEFAREIKCCFDNPRTGGRGAQGTCLDVGRNAAAAIKNPAGGRAKCRRVRASRRRRFVGRWLAGLCRLLILVLVVTDVIVVERAARIVALQRTAVRRVVARGSQRQADIVRRYLKDVLDQALAKTGFAHNQAAPMILNRARHDL